MPPSSSRAEPTNPRATPAARRLLAFLQQTAAEGRTLSGQHNYFSQQPLSSDRVTALTGRAPLIWGGEWGFSDAAHPSDDVAHRPRLIAEMRARHAAGHIVVLTWHQASPAVGEPCPFEGGVKCQISDAQWREVLTPGSPLHHVWLAHVDRLAAGLAEMRDAEVPIVFRPYHEMNGDWFWWGGRSGETNYTALWRALYARLAGYHQLDNLLWAWCSDRPWPGVEAYWPGAEWVDLLGADIYPIEGRPEVFPQEWFDRLHRLAAGKPLALTEHSVLPTAEQLETQPWVWLMGWVDLLFSTNTAEQIRHAYALPRLQSLSSHAAHRSPAAKTTPLSRP